MKHIYKRISGIPYGKFKTRGQKSALQEWTKEIIKQTQSLPKVRDACILRVTFLLPPDKFPSDFPYGPDLDSLLKRFLDALNETIFKDTQGGDSCVVSLHAMKTKVESSKEAGAILEVLPVAIT
jgi:Holliday junction resolvase RusA-like endonuclease